MHFHLPRRHRRRLLLPLGLLALAGLLLLGCLALRPWQERLKRRYALQLTMPIRPRPGDSKSIVKNFAPNLDTLRKYYSCYQTHLSGNPDQDSLLQKQVVLALHRIEADTLHGGVLSIQLGANARYANLVFLLDLMLRENVTRYWLDITRQPTMFYILRPAYQPHAVPLLMCGTNEYLIHLQIPKQRAFGVQFDEWVTDFWQFQWLKQLWQPLNQPEWRAPLALLALLFLQSISRMLTRKPVARTL